MEQILFNLATSTPIPGILVVGGILFLLAAVAGNFGASVTIPKERQAVAGLLGLAFLIGGIGLYIVASSPHTGQSGTNTPTTTTTTTGSSGEIKLGSCSRTQNEINVGADSTGACATVSASEVASAVSQLSLTDLISRLDRVCEDNVSACYQYRAIIPTVIPASPSPSQRVLWGDLAYVSQANLEGRIRRLKCDGNICVYLITDNEPFQVGYPGRGLLLDQSYAGG